MDVTRISALTPGGAADPIEVKVIRRWIPYSRGNKNECCYLFVDKHGDAVEAISGVQDRAHFEAIITLQSCYRVTEYICDRSKPMMKVVPHTVTLRIGKAARFVHIPDVGFPSWHFNFTVYENLHTRLNNNQMLTDYIAKLDNVTDTHRWKNSTLLKLKLQDPSGPFIEATLWEEIAMSFNRDAVRCSNPPVIIVLTSMKVTEYLGTLQLSSTAGTYIYLNPDVDETRSLTTIFSHAKPESALTFKNDASQTESDRNRITIADLLQENPLRHIGTYFTCIASVTSIDEKRGWFYKGCTKCRKKLQPRAHTLACPDHREIAEPKHLFCLTAIIKDDTNTSAQATFFDEAVSSIVERKCIDLVVKEGYTDPDIIPPPLHSIKGKVKVLQIQFGKQNQHNSSPLIVNQVFQFADIGTKKQGSPTAPTIPTSKITDFTSDTHKKPKTSDASETADI